jgi:23S rRNA (guanosine2251-2'-O)-methyltransferase
MLFALLSLLIMRTAVKLKAFNHFSRTLSIRPSFISHRFASSKEFPPESSIVNSFQASYMQNHRFWVNSVELPLNDHKSEDAIVTHICRSIRGVKSSILVNDLSNGEISIPYSDFGLILIPEFQLILPIHGGIAQSQHVKRLDTSFNPPSIPPTSTSNRTSIKLLICGFANRASHRTVSDDDEDNEYDEGQGIVDGSNSNPPKKNKERIIDLDRLQALTHALTLICPDVTIDDLLGDDYQGTPPARICRSYIFPRITAKHLPEPIERSAKRTAEQILLAVRQVKADRASYLINTDKSPGLQNTTLLLNSEDQLVESHTTSTPNLPRHPMILILDNIRSAFNVGSMFRTAETAGIAQIVTCGITAHPPNPKLRKTAFSAIDTVPTQHYDNIYEAIRYLREELDYKICVMETTEMSQIYTDLTYPEKLAIVVGNEVTGVDPKVIESADYVVRIPTFGLKNSLNVAAAAPIMVFEVLRQYHQSKSS